MALAQLVVQVPGTLIKSGDWNGEFQNILTHPIALVSPTTGAINFNLQAHTNLLPATITATGGSAGQALMSTGGTTVSFQPVVSSAFAPAFGSTGQVFAITSSNTGPTFRTIPIDGGLSTTLPTGGMTYSVSTSAALLVGLAIGTSGQVYMTGTSGAPIWANLTSASGSASGTRNISQFQIVEDFIGNLSTVTANSGNSTSVDLTGGGAGNVVFPSGIWAFTSGALNIEQPLGMATLTALGGGVPKLYLDLQGFVFSTAKVTFETRWVSQLATSGSGQRMVGFQSSGSLFGTTGPTWGVFLLATDGNATVNLITVTSSGTSSLSAGVTANAFHDYKFVMTSSSVDLTVDGAVVGSLTSNIPQTSSSPMLMGFSIAGAVVSGNGIKVDYLSYISSGRSQF